MPGLYHADAVDAYRTLKADGGSGTLTTFVETHDPVAQTKSRVPTNHTFYAVSQKASTTAYRAAQVGATAMIDRKRDLIYMAPLTDGLVPVPLPTVADKVAWRGATWAVLWGAPLDPAGDEAVLYEVLIER